MMERIAGIFRALRTRQLLMPAGLGLGLIATGCTGSPELRRPPDSEGHAQGIESIRILVPAAPGGGWDQTGRALQQAMQSGKLVGRVTVDNRGGAGGTIGLAQFVSSRKGDPNALLVGGMVMMGAIYLNKSPVDLSRVTPIARLTGEYEVVVVPANSKIQSLKDLISQFKANPGGVSWAGGSAGGTEHILAAMIAQAEGVDPSAVNYIPYAGGGEAQAAILGGHVTVGVGGYAEFAGQIKAKKLRALAISSERRILGIEIPTLKEQGLDVELFNWRSVFGAPGITERQKKKLVLLLQQTVKTESWQGTMKQNQWTDLFLAGDEFETFLDAEQTRISEIMGNIQR